MLRRYSISGEEMVEVIFCNRNEIPDELLKFAVIIARYEDKYIFCRHKLRDTWEVPGGHRENGETIEQTAERELKEESGALEFNIDLLTVYGVKTESDVTYGMLFTARVFVLGDLSEDFEIAELCFCDSLPEMLTYPEIQPKLWEYTLKNWRINDV